MQITVGTDNSGPLPEWIIIELQGLLECKNDTEEMGGKFVGDLHYTKEVKLICLLICYCFIPYHHPFIGYSAANNRPPLSLWKNREVGQTVSDAY